MGSYQRVCETVVFRYYGFVAQYRGDSLEVYFGYPLAHEDDASRAVLCALEMLEAVQQLANATKSDLQVRIGIDSGRVVVGTLGNIGGRSALPSVRLRTLPPAYRRRPLRVRWSSRTWSGGFCEGRS